MNTYTNDQRVLPSYSICKDTHCYAGDTVNRIVDRQQQRACSRRIREYGYGVCRQEICWDDVAAGLQEGTKSLRILVSVVAQA